MSFITPETFFIALSLAICAVIYVLRGRKIAPHGDLTDKQKIDIVPGGEAASDDFALLPSVAVA